MLDKALFLLALNSYYFGSAAILIFGLFFLYTLFNIRVVSVKEIIFISGFFLFLFVKIILSEGPILELLNDIRFFWAFYVFYLFFKSRWKSIDCHKNSYNGPLAAFFYCSIALTLFEFFSTNYLGLEWVVRTHNVAFELQEGLARSYGFGANATVTSVILVLLSAWLTKSVVWDFIILVFVTSGTAFGIFVIKLIFKMKLSYKISVILFLILIYPFLMKNFPSFSKISIDYFDYILDFKMGQISKGFSSDDFKWLWGAGNLDGLRTGDFQALDFILFNGFVGVIIFFCIIWQAVNCTNAFFVISMLVATLHYQVIFSLPGSIIFGFFLSIPCSLRHAKKKGGLG